MALACSLAITLALSLSLLVLLLLSQFRSRHYPCSLGFSLAYINNQNEEDNSNVLTVSEETRDDFLGEFIKSTSEILNSEILNFEILNSEILRNSQF